MPHENPFGFGAIESTQDNRTVPYEPTLAALYTEGGYDYLPEDILHQHKVGICTAIHLVQYMQKVTGRKYSPEFQYYLQKKFYDGNWEEGSSVLNSLKVGKRFGFLPMHKWIYTTEADRTLPYNQYITKLKAIPDVVIDRLLSECIDPLQGYTQVNVNNPVDIARAISESKAGILCRYVVGKEWFTAPINPLRPPQQVISGHAIIMSRFNYTQDTWQKLANTWGAQWNLQGLADIDWQKYRMTEAWLITNKTYFIDDLKIGNTNPDVKRLQQFLNTHGFPVAEVGAGSPGNETSYFGQLTEKAVIKYQKSRNIQPSVGYFGIISRTKVNSEL